MADVVLGDILVQLRLNSQQFTQGIQAALQALQQFQQQVQQQGSSVQQGMAQAAQGTQQFAQQLQLLNQQAISQTGFLGQISAQLSQLQANLQQTGQTAVQAGQQLQQSGKAAGQGWQAIVQIASGIGLETTIQGLVGAMRDFASSVVEVGVRMETLRISFANLFGGQAGGAQTFGQLTQLAQRYGVELTGLAQNYQRFAAAVRGTSLEGERGRQVFENFLVGLRGFGATSAQSERVMEALVQTLQRGQVSMEELRRQMGQVIPGFGELAKGLGVSTEELERMTKSGLAAGSAMEALGRQLRQDFGPAADEASRKAGAAFQAFRNEIILTKDVIAQQLLPTLARAAQISTDWLAQVRKGLAEAQQLRQIGTQEALLGTGLRAEDLSRLTDEQRRRFETLNRLITEQRTAQQLGGAPMFGPTRPEYIAQLEQERAAILQIAQAEKDRAGAQAVAANARGRETDELNRQKDFEQQIATILKDVAQRREQFRQAAALQPEVLGRPQGTPEQVQLFLREQQRVLQEPLEQLRTAITGARGVAPTAEQMTQVRALSQEYGRLGDAITSSREAESERQKAAREAEQEQERLMRERRQAVFETGRVINQAYEEEARQQEQAIANLRRLVEQYATLPAIRDADKAAELEQALATSRHSEEAQRLSTFLQNLIARQQQLRQEAALSEGVGRAAMENARATDAFTQRIQQQLDLVGQTREELPEARLRARARREGLTLTEDQEAMLQRLTRVREEQQRLHEAARVFQELGEGVGNAWTNALTGIASGTQTVAQAFRQMAQSILQSLIQITSQEAWRALIRVGVGLLTSAATSGATGGGGAITGPETGPVGSVGYGINPRLMAEGGVASQPTFAYIAERGQPEAVVNRSQMAELMQFARSAGPSAGGQAAGSNVSVILVDSRVQADQEAARQRALGREVIVQEVARDLSKGEASTINRMLRTIQR